MSRRLRASRRCRNWARDEGGQMMLLAGFVFVIGLLIVAASISRVPLLAKQLSREQDRPILAEAGPMLQGLDAALLSLAEDFQPGLMPGTPEFRAAVEGLLAHLRALEASRGFMLEWSLQCDDDDPDPAQAWAQLELSDGEMWIESRTGTFALDACP